jgi:hypothetical protein
MIKIQGVDQSSACDPIVILAHKNACPVFSATTSVRFLLDRPYILAPLLIIFGFLVTYVGRKFFAWTIAVIGCALGFGVTMLLFNMFTMLESFEQQNS